MGLFTRDPLKKQKRIYQQKLEAAMLAMRRGDVRQNAFLTAQAQTLWAEIEKRESAAGER